MIAKLHYITQEVEGVGHHVLAEHACKGGVRWVQLRVKNKPFDEWLAIAQKTLAVCKQYGAKLIVNDSVKIAAEIGADGVHLGKDDGSHSEARRILGSGFIIGGSTNSMYDVRSMMDEGVDYVGVGPFRFTSTKEKLNPVLGLDGIREIAAVCRLQNITIPMIAIGGIRAEDVTSLIEAGVHGVAVSSAINLAEDREKATQYFLKELKEREPWNH